MAVQVSRLAGSALTAIMPSPIDTHSSSITYTTPNSTAEAHKARINSDIINLFKTPPVPNANPPSIKGIGLYTHIAAPTNPPTGPDSETHPDPVFLPNPQPPTAKAPSNPPLPEEIRILCSDLRTLIRDEEAAVAKRELSFEELSKRYAGLPIPLQSTSAPAAAPGETSKKDGQHVRLDVPGDPTALVVREKGDVIMWGTEEETTRRLPPSTHVYREDPRRRR